MLGKVSNSHASIPIPQDSQFLNIIISLLVDGQYTGQSVMKSVGLLTIASLLLFISHLQSTQTGAMSLSIV